MTAPHQRPGERMVWLVPSNSRAGLEHVVDIEANGYYGACSCENFTFGDKGKPSKQTLAANKHQPIEDCRCPHIEPAREAFCHNRAHFEAQRIYDKVYAQVFAACVEAIRPR